MNLAEKETFPVWKDIEVAGSIASPRHGACVVKISHNKIFVSGGWCKGYNNGQRRDKFLNDSFLLDIDEQYKLKWARIQLTGDTVTPARKSASASFVKDKIYIFGGGRLWSTVQRETFDDLYVVRPDLSSASWHQELVPTQGPVPARREGHTATVVNNRYIYIFGGFDGFTNFSDMHILDTETLTWKPPEIAGGLRPPSRVGHSMVLYKRKLILFGGSRWDGYSGTIFNDLWSFDIDALCWQRLQPKRKFGPCRRFAHSACQIGCRMVVVGGWGFDDEGNPLYLDDVWVLDTETLDWRHQVVSGEPLGPRYGHCAVALGLLLLVLFGHDGHMPRNDAALLALEGTASLCSPPRPSSSLPSDLGSLLHSGALSDLTLSVGFERFPVHRCILASRSPVFARSFTIGMQESRSGTLEVHGIDPPVMKALLDYIYTNQCVITDSIAVPLLAAANLYQVLGLKATCEALLAEALDLANCVCLSMLADDLSAPHLLCAGINYLALNWHALPNTTSHRDAVDGDVTVRDLPSHVLEAVTSRRAELEQARDVTEGRRKRTRTMTSRPKPGPERESEPDRRSESESEPEPEAGSPLTPIGADWFVYISGSDNESEQPDRGPVHM